VRKQHQPYARNAVDYSFNKEHTLTKPLSNHRPNSQCLSNFKKESLPYFKKSHCARYSGNYHLQIQRVAMKEIVCVFGKNFNDIPISQKQIYPDFKNFFINKVCIHLVTIYIFVYIVQELPEKYKDV
jgi:hypothetical protein